ncbi:TIGR02757 family protein [Schleiferia thermophila]|jgi:uncharacterized protein (TIGR02757 family)|uniref:Uncharacterized protein (TIGR02757 family) n=1 Tax=Schleiferia thermophila TaxID=884107 RepID=A0A369A4E2_9FLAO|nr:TIGR02757 family protein [Schleiferia thermophila]KFD39307.1 hypothetical protein AT05_05515 [Schleiferia thermophila str. Yellowstone]RCX03216.1 uncharacterized protein (TIGR02757 family) [Schleiferia thermophila]GCD80343.1 TIGR02757 family protein [Schleiferia thermophila]
MKNPQSLKRFLDEKASYYESEHFIPFDPISVPHRFSLKQDIEISGLLTAIISWGSRKSIIQNAQKLMMLMDNTPFDFVQNHSDSDLKSFRHFVHRTFNHQDAVFFIKALHAWYQENDSLETGFLPETGEDHLLAAIHRFRNKLFSYCAPGRTAKHIADPQAGSSAKRINMFLRWMVRSNANGVDFGIWKNISPSLLSCPLDVHTGHVARALGLISRKQNDRKALEELDASLRLFDPEDPVKYDFALFGLGQEGITTHLQICFV